jgi:DHA2 family multidrug resistance protein
MVVLDGTIVNVAIPTIMATFGVTISEVVWVSTAYLIALSILLATAGWLSDHFGPKKVYLVGLIIFTVSSYLCGIAWNLHSLIIFRIIQGIGGGILTPVGMTLFTGEFTKEQRTLSLGFYSIAIAAAISLGPSVGGYLIQTVGWGWIFFINVPFGAISLVAAYIIFKKSEGKKIVHFDVWGFLWLSLFLIFLIEAISSGNAPWNAEGWLSFFTLSSFAVSIFSLVAFLYVELTSNHPIVDLSVFKYRDFMLGNIVLFIFSLTLFGSSFLIPLYLQSGLDYSKLRTGMMILPIGLTQGIFGAASGLATKYFPAKFMVIIGIIGLGISYYFNAQFTLYTEQSQILWLFTFRGIAMALMFAPLITLTLKSIPEEKMAQATGLFSVQRQVGAAIGVAVFETIFANRQTYHSAIYGDIVDSASPAFQKVQTLLETHVQSSAGSSFWDASAQASQLILMHIEKNVFVQAIGDNFLIAGVVTLLSCIPLFFIKK